jgi:PAS domain S-box-containing protein
MNMQRLDNEYEREPTAWELKLFRTLLDQSNDAIEVFDPESLRFLDVNEKACVDLGYNRKELLSMSIFDIDPTLDHSSAKRIVEELRKSGSVTRETSHRRKDGSTFPVEVNIKHVPLDWDYIVTVVRDTTERRRAEEGSRKLSVRLLQLQDEERRRIARELHETTAQDLSGLRLCLGQLKGLEAKLPVSAQRIIANSLEISERIIEGIRVLSYGLHPPLLEETGLSMAVAWYARGFARRSGIEIKVEIPDGFGRLPQEHETTLFRILQECLVNIDRHANSRWARIHMTRQADSVSLEVEDRGQGMGGELRPGSQAAQEPGVGIAGMRERVKQLHGVFEIESAPGRGTTVRAVLPIPAHLAAPNASGGRGTAR